MPPDFFGAAVALLGTAICGLFLFRANAMRDWQRAYWQARPDAFMARANLHMLEGRHFVLLSRLGGGVVGAAFLFFAYVAFAGSDLALNAL